jgi:bifunctional DNase/RNase
MASILVTVAGLALDEKTKAPIVVLKDETGLKVLPIVIGLMEASAIAARLEGVDFPRPMTHDLVVAIIEKTGGLLEKMEVCDLINDTFYATLHVRTSQGEVVQVDARPSDSIALALRGNAPIYVDEKVFEKSSRKAPEPEGEDTLKNLLETMEDEDFGKYKM